MIVSLHPLAEAELVEGTSFYAQEGGRTLAAITSSSVSEVSEESSGTRQEL